MNSQVDKEKDDLLDRFCAFANDMLCDIHEAGYWGDFCDPCSGLPMRSDGNTVYGEILGLEKVRRFQTTEAGACRVALHPLWGANMYPATIFTTAPPAFVENWLSKNTTSE